ncbi:hypothetical protein V6N13_014635 [Hibiscus sabdariffa]
MDLLWPILLLFLDKISIICLVACEGNNDGNSSDFLPPPGDYVHNLELTLWIVYSKYHVSGVAWPGSSIPSQKEEFRIRASINGVSGSMKAGGMILWDKQKTCLSNTPHSGYYATKTCYFEACD